MLESVISLSFPILNCLFSRLDFVMAMYVHRRRNGVYKIPYHLRFWSTTSVEVKGP